MTLITLIGRESLSKHMLFANAQKPFCHGAAPFVLHKSNLTEPCYKLPVQYICDIGTVIRHSTM